MRNGNCLRVSVIDTSAPQKKKKKKSPLPTHSEKIRERKLICDLIISNSESDLLGMRIVSTSFSFEVSNSLSKSNQRRELMISIGKFSGRKKLKSGGREESSIVIKND